MFLDGDSFVICFRPEPVNFIFTFILCELLAIDWFIVFLLSLLFYWFFILSLLNIFIIIFLYYYFFILLYLLSLLYVFYNLCSDVLLCFLILIMFLCSYHCAWFVCSWECSRITNKRFIFLSPSLSLSLSLCACMRTRGQACEWVCVIQRSIFLYHLTFCYKLQ